MDSLPQKLLHELENRLEEGPYASLAELIEEALKALDEAVATEDWLEDKLREGEASGPAAPMTQQDWDDIERKGLERIRAKSSK